MDTNPTLEEIKNAIIAGDTERVVALVERAFAEQVDPMACIDLGLTPGMDRVGELFATGDYFLPDLIAAGEAMKNALAVLEPSLLTGQQRKLLGHIVLGTVEGDLHEIGKTLVGTMLSANGFRVTDLGVNCSAQVFMEAVEETGATMIGASALLTTTMVKQRELVASLQEAGMRASVKVLVGGAPVSQAWAEEIGADGYAQDAVGAVALAKRIAGV